MDEKKIYLLKLLFIMRNYGIIKVIMCCSTRPHSNYPCTIAEHLLRAPLCDELSTLKKVGYCVAFIFVGLLTLFTVHMIYNCCIREALLERPSSRKFTEYREGKVDDSSMGNDHPVVPPASSARKNGQQQPRMGNVTHASKPSFLGSIPSLKELSLRALLPKRDLSNEESLSRHLIPLVKEKKIDKQMLLTALETSCTDTLLFPSCSHLVFQPSDFSANLRWCGKIDLSGCQLQNPNKILNALGAHLPELYSLSLWNTSPVSISTFNAMSKKCPRLASVAIAFQDSSSMPFIHCTQLISVRYSLTTFQWKSFKTFAQANIRLHEATIWCTHFDQMKFKWDFDKADHTIFPHLEFLTVVAPHSARKNDVDKTHWFLLTKHQTLCTQFSVAYIDASRAFVSLPTLTDQTFIAEITERQSCPIKQSKNFNPVAFKEWLRSIKHDPEQVKTFISALLFHFFKIQQDFELQQLEEIFLEELSVSELAAVTSLLGPLIADGVKAKEKAIYNNLWLNFLDGLRAFALKSVSQKEKASCIAYALYQFQLG